MARVVTGVAVESKVEVGEGTVPARPAPAAHCACPRCGAELTTAADLRRVRHVVLRCACGAFQRVALAA